jgi:HAD superfamily hydrolase (TIGR01493 family)
MALSGSSREIRIDDSRVMAVHRDEAMTMTSPARRDFLLSGSALAIAAAAVGSSLAGVGKAHGESLPTSPANAIKALFFDVFGTLVDWRTGVARDAELVLRPLGYSIDWVAFADAWRDQYQPGMEEVRSGRMPYMKLDVLHRRMLQQCAPRFGLEKLENAVLDRLTLAWHHLPAWQDSPAGLARLRQRFLVAPFRMAIRR